VEILNCKITCASITMTDRGLTFYLVLNGGAIGAKFGGYLIGNHYVGTDEYSSDGAGIVAMMKIMDVIEVTEWEDLVGKYCRIEYEGLDTVVHKIGNIIHNKWFDIQDFFKNYEPTSTFK